MHIIASAMSFTLMFQAVITFSLNEAKLANSVYSLHD